MELKSLYAQEREIISRELGREQSARSIGKLLGRHHSTIVREVERNGGAADYRAVAAQERYDRLKVRPDERKLIASTRLHDAVNEGLENKWSPEQISTRPKKDQPGDPEMHVSHETAPGQSRRRRWSPHPAEWLVDPLADAFEDSNP